MGDSNMYGAFLALTVPATLALLWDPRTKKLLAYFACFITMMALLLTGSRGAFVGIVVGCVFATFFLRSFISLRQIALTTVISIFVITVMFVIILSTDLFGDLVQHGHRRRHHRNAGSRQKPALLPSVAPRVFCRRTPAPTGSDKVCAPLELAVGGKGHAARDPGGWRL